MAYINKNKIVFPSDFQQLFQYQPSSTMTINVQQLCNLRLRKVITDLDMTIIHFIYHCGIATFDQLMRLTKCEDENLLLHHLNTLTRNRIINRFTFADGTERTIAPDAFLMIACDKGAALLMKHFSDEESDYDNWRVETTIMTPIKVQKRLLMSEFYLRMMESCPTKIVKYDTTPIFVQKRDRITPRFVFAISTGKDHRYYVCETVSEDDLSGKSGNSFVQRCLNDAKLDAESIKSLYNESCTPAFLLIAENDDVAQRAAEIAVNAGITTFRLTTAERMQRPTNAKGFMLKFENNALIEVTTKLFIE